MAPRKVPTLYAIMYLGYNLFASIAFLVYFSAANNVSHPAG